MNSRKIVFLILILIICGSGYLHPISPSSGSSPKLDLVFVLHANQALVPYGDIANDLCYRGVFETLLAHPSVHITIHVSGTLLSFLSYYQRDTIDLIRQGISIGQFEILGSTYSQNVMYSHVEPGSSNYTSAFFDNEIQLRLHREVLQAQLGVSPTGFWNPERVWDPNVVLPIIKNGSYEYTFIEDHIISQVSSSSEYLIRTTNSQEDPLYVFNDDKSAISYFNTIAAPSGGADPNSHLQTAINDSLEFLEALHVVDTSDEYAVVYAEDMEAWGLWQEESRDGWTDSLANVLYRLDALLSAFEEASSWLAVRTPSEILSDLKARSYTFEHHNSIPFGEAAWMHDAATSQSNWVSWKHWQNADSDLASYRDSFEVTRDILASIKRKIGLQGNAGQSVTGAWSIYHYAEYVFAANQFEFGCWGCKFWWYHRVKTALHAARAAEYALNPSSSIEAFAQDIDLDGNEEYILQNTGNRFVFSTRGGRLINWFDVEKGLVVIENDAPTSYTHSAIPFDSVPEDPTDFWGRSTKEFYLRYKAFNDFLDSPREHVLANLIYAAQIETKNAVTFELNSTNYANIQKKYYLETTDSDVLKVQYDVKLTAPASKEFLVGCSFSVNNTDMLVNGHDNIFLRKDDSDRIRGIGNLDSGFYVALSAPSAITIKNDSRHLFEEMVLLNFGVLSVGDTRQFKISLTLLPLSAELPEESEVFSNESKEDSEESQAQWPSLAFTLGAIAIAVFVHRKRKFPD